MSKDKAKQSGKENGHQPPLRLEYLSPAELAENPRNWRTHPESQISALTDVISEVGWAGACLYNERTQRLIDGHARRKVAAAQGAEKIPVLIGSWDEVTEAKILATLDPLAALAEADKGKLDALLREVDTGSEALQEMLAELAKDAGLYQSPEVQQDEVPEPPKVPVTKPGDLWLLGEHRVLCCDSTYGESVKRLFAGGRASLLFTSPPYGQQRDYGVAKEHVKDWDGLMKGVFQHAATTMEPDGQILVNLGLIHRDGEWIPYWDGWIAWMREQGWRRFGWYVWDQQRGLPGNWNGRFAPSHEFIFHFNKQPAQPQKHIMCNLERAKQERNKIKNGSVKTGLRAKDGSVVELSSPGTVGQFQKVPDSVLRFERHMANDIARRNHPATFPVPFASHILKSWPGLVYDPFLGSGTTLIAAEQLSRRCYGMEIEPAYCDVICERWSKLTGKQPILESTGKTFEETKTERASA